MVVEQLDGDGLEGPGDRGDLVEDLDAVLVLAHHPLQPSHLSLDAAQPPVDGVLVVAVTRHVRHYTPLGYQWNCKAGPTGLAIAIDRQHRDL